MTRVLVCGGRDYNNAKKVDEVLDSLHAETCEGISHIVHGGAKGADALAGRWADTNDVPAIVFPADWKRHGPAAGPIRNEQMIWEGKPDLVVAFPGGRGTADMVRRAHSADINVIEVEDETF